SVDRSAHSSSDRAACPIDYCAVPSILPPSYQQQHGHAEWVELASDRKLRTRNKINYRLAHWPIWIWVFFIAPGPITFALFAHGPTRPMMLWLLAVLGGTGIARRVWQRPGVE